MSRDTAFTKRLFADQPAHPHILSRICVVRVDSLDGWRPIEHKAITLNSLCICVGWSASFITKTCLYNFYPLKPHFYIVKPGFTGVYVIFLISAQKIDCAHSLEPPRRGGSNEYPQSMFWAEIWKQIRVFLWKFSVFGGEIFYIFE